MKYDTLFIGSLLFGILLSKLPVCAALSRKLSGGKAFRRLFDGKKGTARFLLDTAAPFAVMLMLYGGLLHCIGARVIAHVPTMLLFGVVCAALPIGLSVWREAAGYCREKENSDE